MLTIRTLGNFDVLLDGVSLLESTEVKRGLFLVYLAEQKEPQPRIDVARLFWPKVEDKAVQVNLRSLLLRLRREGLEEYLDAGRSTVALTNWEKIDYDGAQLRSLTVKGKEAQFSDLLDAADLYQGGFLDTLVIDDYPHLNEWASSVRVEMELRTIHLLSKLVTSAILSGSTESMLHHAEKLVALAPFEDATHALYMQALASAGRIADALSHFYQYRRQLREERQSDVGRELIEVMARLTRPGELLTISAKDSATRAEEILSAEESSHKEHYFPHIEHPMIGRSREGAQLLEHLDKGTRLVTVVGIGGTGKTFFVRSQYDHLAERFGNNLYYADLRSDTVTPQQAANSLLLAVAAAMRIRPQAGRTLLELVSERLYEKKCCLILDNFETVQSAALTVLDLLKAAPELTILVTSRERLNVSTEAVLILSGLNQAPSAPGNIPSAPQGTLKTENSGSRDDNRHSSDAVLYFLQCVRRQDPNYPEDEETLSWIQTICREVDALPLAIELLAMQVPFFALTELVKRLRMDRSMLAGEYGDLPGDHYSVWAVLDNMWQTLNETEQRVLAELSVFAGAFHREAMMNVTPAERSVYTRLLNTSLLRAEEPAWFSLHPLVKQYAAQRLAAQRLAAQRLTSDSANERHTHYFLEMFAGGMRMREGLVAQQLPIPPMAVRCHADIGLAWQWAVTHASWEVLDRSLLRFSRYMDVTFQAEELVQHMRQLLDALPPVEERNQQQHRLAGRAAYNLANYNSSPELPMAFWWERSLLWLEAAGDPWDLAASVLAYVDTPFVHSRSWARVESLLAQAAQLIDKYQLEPLRVVSDFTACTYYLYQGQWANLRDTQAALLTRMARPAHSTSIADHLLIAAFLDDWQQVYQLAERIEIDNANSPALSSWKQWAAHYISNATVSTGDMVGAIAQRLSILDGYASNNAEILLPMAYGELALWQQIVGDTVTAQASAAEALLHVEQNLDSLAAAFGQLFVGVFHYHSQETDKAIPLIDNALTLGRQLHHATMVFSATYYLAQIHIDKLPADLVQRITQIGAVSPAMHFVLRPLARRHLAAQRLVIAVEARETLWATDMTVVEALVDEVMERIA